MYVQEIEFFVLDDTHHLARQGEFVGRVFKQRVRSDIDLVIEEVLVKKIEAGRLGIRHEMNLMAFLGQRFPDIRGYYATSAEGWITDNNEYFMIHGLGFQRQ